MNDKETESTPQQPKASTWPADDNQAIRRQTPDTSRPDVFNPVSAPATPGKKRKGPLISLIGTALVLLGLGLAYVYWYQNPNKVVSDAVINALAADSLTYTGTVTTVGPTKMVATLDGGAALDGATVNAKFAFDVEGKKYTLDGNGVIDEKSDLYVKVRNIDGLVNNYRRAMPPDSQKLFDQIIDKIDDKWIKISSEDVKSYSANVANIQKCTAELASKIKNDKNVEAELINAYKKHPFITIDKSLGAKDGSLGYTLSSNQSVTKDFTKEYKNTSLYQSTVKCNSSFAIKDEDILQQYKDEPGNQATVDLWVDRWTHQITNVVMKNEDKTGEVNVSFKPKFNRPVAIVPPKDSTTLEQLQNDVQELLRAAQPAPTSAPATE